MTMAKRILLITADGAIPGESFAPHNDEVLDLSLCERKIKNNKETSTMLPQANIALANAPTL